jgi:NUMOD3 motif-containing protein
LQRIMSKPYVYYIRWTDAGKQYLGCEYKDGCHPDMFWKTYRTTSSMVNCMLYDPDVIMIVRICSSPEEARDYEERYLKFFRAAQTDSWLNRSNGGRNFVTPEHVSESTRAKMSAARAGKLGTRKGKKNKNPLPSRFGEKNSFFGRKHSKETKQRNREAHLGKPGLVGETNPMFGKKHPNYKPPMAGRKHSPETLEKMKAAWLRRKERSRG